MYCTVLYTVSGILYSTALYCTILYCTVLYCIVNGVLYIAVDDAEEEDLGAVFEGRGHEGHDL